MDALKKDQAEEGAQDAQFMALALELARRGEGYVEPNPMVGCAVVRHGRLIGEGWHRRFGGPHAEVEALKDARRHDDVAGATVYVTLEPCCIQGKTPPCTRALIDAGIVRVVAATADPNPQVEGRGLKQLADAGVEVLSGILEQDAKALIAPFRKLQTQSRPWVIAKWAMSLDGKIAAADGSSKWITGEPSRQAVGRLRGRVDAILVGRRTAQLDDPLLTARPPGPRQAMRIVLDSESQLSAGSQLIRSAGGPPVMVVAGKSAPAYRMQQLESAGAEVLRLESASHSQRLEQLLDELGRRKMTNVLVEGGGQLLGALWDAQLIDEAHVFVAPKLIGGRSALSPLSGSGVDNIRSAVQLHRAIIQQLGDDVYVHGRTAPD